jgi:hypothetical protein
MHVMHVMPFQSAQKQPQGKEEYVLKTCSQLPCVAHCNFMLICLFVYLFICLFAYLLICLFAYFPSGRFIWHEVGWAAT